MKLNARSIDGSFALEVHGLELWREHDAGAVEAIRDAWCESGVLVFRRQSLSEDELVTYCSRFGAPEIIVRTDWQSKNRPEVVQLSNLKDAAGESIGGLGAGELDWHTDQSYVADPATGALIYMVEMPREGGRTYWANLRLAYAALPRHLKEEIEGLSAVYDYLKRQSSYDDEKPMSPELRSKTPPVKHPIVAEHPVTGEKSLYLDPSTTVGIDGLSAEEGTALLQTLNVHATRPEFVYAHQWQIGDVVMWDNGFMLHRRDAFDAHRHRWLKRLTMKLSRERHIVPETSLVA